MNRPILFSALAGFLLCGVCAQADAIFEAVGDIEPGSTVARWSVSGDSIRSVRGTVYGRDGFSACFNFDSGLNIDSARTMSGHSDYNWNGSVSGDDHSTAFGCTSNPEPSCEVHYTAHIDCEPYQIDCVKWEAWDDHDQKCGESWFDVVDDGCPHFEPKPCGDDGSPVPEPFSMMFLGSALVGVVGFRMRQRCKVGK